MMIRRYPLRLGLWKPATVATLALGAVAAADPRGRSLLANTTLLALGAAAISMPLGTLLAVLVFRTDLAGRRAVAVLLGVMLFVPLYVQAGAWIFGFGLQGWQSTTAGTAPLLAGLSGAAWIHGVAAVPWVALIVGLGLRQVEPQLEESALLDAGPARVFICVTLRRAIGSLGIALLWIVILAAGEMTIADLFRVRTYAEEVYTAFAATGDVTLASLAVLPGAGLTGLLALAALAVCARLMPLRGPLGLRPPRLHTLGRWRLAAAAAVGLVLVLIVGVPLAGLCYKGGIATALGAAGPARTWSAEHLATMILGAPARFAKELQSSLIISTMAATLAATIATLLAWTGRAGGRRGWLVLSLVALLLAIPVPILGLAVMWLFDSGMACAVRLGANWLIEAYDRLYDSPLRPATALTLRALPLSTLILWHAVRTISDPLLESAALDGAGFFRRLFQIALPARREALALAWLVAFLVSWGDLAASQPLTPPGWDTLTLRIFDRLHTGADDQVAGACLAMLLALIPLALMLALLLRRLGGRAAGPLR